MANATAPARRSPVISVPIFSSIQAPQQSYFAAAVFLNQFSVHCPPYKTRTADKFVTSLSVLSENINPHGPPFSHGRRPNPFPVLWPVLRNQHCFPLFSVTCPFAIRTPLMETIKSASFCFICHTKKTVLYWKNHRIIWRSPVPHLYWNGDHYENFWKWIIWKLFGNYTIIE